MAGGFWENNDRYIISSGPGGGEACNRAYVERSIQFRTDLVRGMADGTLKFIRKNYPKSETADITGEIKRRRVAGKK